MICNICPRLCGAERTETAGAGRCGQPSLPVVARAALHFWEEPCISGTRGSGTVFFTGCPLGCVFCQNGKISHDHFGKIITVERLRQAGSPSVHLTRLTSIHDTTGLYTDKQGRPYQYDPHCAWIPVLNDQCTDPTTGQTLFQWLAQQSR